jgi:hypothetical protein
MTKMTGGCLCGAVRFTAEGVDPKFSVCHCGMCRRWSGGAPLFAASTKSVTFEAPESVSRYASSSWAERGFCAKCGTSLFYFYKPANIYSMSVGTFDDPSPFTIASEIFIDQKPPGYDLAGDHPRLTEAETLAKFAKG